MSLIFDVHISFLHVMFCVFVKMYFVGSMSMFFPERSGANAQNLEHAQNATFLSWGSEGHSLNRAAHKYMCNTRSQRLKFVTFFEHFFMLLAACLASIVQFRSNWIFYHSGANPLGKSL